MVKELFGFRHLFISVCARGDDQVESGPGGVSGSMQTCEDAFTVFQNVRDAVLCVRVQIHNVPISQGRRYASLCPAE